MFLETNKNRYEIPNYKRILHVLAVNELGIGRICLKGKVEIPVDKFTQLITYPEMILHRGRSLPREMEHPVYGHK